MKVHRMSNRPSHASVQRPQYQSQYLRKVLPVSVGDSRARGVLAAEFVGKASPQPVPHRIPEFVPRQLPTVLPDVAFGFGSPASVDGAFPSREQSPRDALSSAFQRHRQTASSSAFQSMRQRFATPTGRGLSEFQ